MNAAELNVSFALIGKHGPFDAVAVAARNTLRHWQGMGSPVEWEEAIVRLADALIAESKGE